MAFDNLRGSLWMIGSMAGFAAEDGFLKAASHAVPLGQVLLVEGVVGILWFSAIALSAGMPPVPRAALSRTMAVRSGFEGTGRLFYALAIALTPISTASAIHQATPHVVVPASALLFGEKDRGVPPAPTQARHWPSIAARIFGVVVALAPVLEPVADNGRL